MAGNTNGERGGGGGGWVKILVLLGAIGVAVVALVPDLRGALGLEPNTPPPRPLEGDTPPPRPTLRPIAFDPADAGDGGAPKAVRILVPAPPYSPDAGIVHADTVALLGLSADGRTALVRLGDLPYPIQSNLHTLSLDVETGVSSVMRFPTLWTLPFQGGETDTPAEKHVLSELLHDPAMVDDIARYAAALSGASLRLEPRFVLSPAGDTVAFNVGDFVHLASADGRELGRVYARSSYDPTFSGDGKTLYFSCLHGKGKGFAGNYDLCAVPVAGAAPKAPRFVATSIRFLVAASSDAGSLFVTTDPPDRDAGGEGDAGADAKAGTQECLDRVDVASTPPKRTRLACGNSLTLSRPARALTVTTTTWPRGPNAKPDTHISWIDPQTGDARATATVSGQEVGLRQDGLALYSKTPQKSLLSCLEILDPNARTRTMTKAGSVPFGLAMPYGTVFFGDSLVYTTAFGLGLLVVDLARLEKGPARPLSDPPGECQ